MCVDVIMCTTWRWWQNLRHRCRQHSISSNRHLMSRVSRHSFSSSCYHLWWAEEVWRPPGFWTATPVF